MSRRPAFSLAYTYEKAFASLMPQTFGTPAGIPAQTQAILDRLDEIGVEAREHLADCLETIRHLSEAEAANAQGAPRFRA